MFSNNWRCLRIQIMFTVVVMIVTLVFAECPINCHCSRYKTFCTEARLRTLPTQLPSTTQHLKIELDYIPQINSTSGLQNLTHLELKYVNLMKIQPGTFQNMSQLQYLSITHNNITILKTNSFQYLQNLYFLNLSRNQITDLEPGTFSGLSSIRILDLSFNNIRKLTESAFEGMAQNLDCMATKIYYIFFENHFSLSPFEPVTYKYLCTLSHFFFGDIRETHIPAHVSFGVAVSRYSTHYYYQYPGFIYKNMYNRLEGLNYLVVREETTYDIFNILNFQNMTDICYLDLTHNKIYEINSGDLIRLSSVKTLKLNDNDIRSLSNKSFLGLNSLKYLEIRHNRLQSIESEAFYGLSRLQMLDLSWNNLTSLKNYTFSSLENLKELKLDENPLQTIGSRAFSHLWNLKNCPYPITSHFTINSLIVLTALGIKKRLNFLPHIEKDSFVNLTRLDTFELASKIDLPQEIQVLKNLNLYLDARQINQQTKVDNFLINVRYFNEINVTLIESNSTNILQSLSNLSILSLTLMYSDFKILKKNSFLGLSTLRYLTILDKDLQSIQREAFHDMSSLIELHLFSGQNLTFEKGSFYGLINLKRLSIWRVEENKLFKYLNKGMFQGLHKLTRLELKEIYISSINPGAFEGLNNIQEIYLNRNRITNINPGVFGAQCKKVFKVTCKNVTLPEYCNNTNALTSLKFLNLAGNNISHIHPFAFISCINLNTLDLSQNWFLTLDNTFLYTPALRVLNFQSCQFSNIPNDTFLCTPQLNEIYFSWNSELKAFRVTPLLPLRHLQKIDISFTNIVCNCEFYETWKWMRQNGVHYEAIGRYRRYDTFCGDKNIDHTFSNINCSYTDNKLPSIKNHTKTSNDFEFFKLYVEPNILIIIFIFGLVCNGFLLFVALRHSDMRTKQNACVIHLAIVDVLSLLLNLPLSYWDVVNVRWEFDETLCKIFIISKDITVSVTVLSIVALSVERFLVARNFNNFKKICKSGDQSTTWLLVMTWISAIVMSLPGYFSAVVDIRCLYCPPGNKDYIRNVWTFQLIMYCIIPAIAISFLNIKTSLYLRESIRKIPGEIKDNIKAKNRKTGANIVLILVAVFLLSYLPNYILRLLVAWSIVDMEQLFLGSFFTFCLFFCNTIFNPISIFIMSSKFKSYAISYFPFLEKEQIPKSVPVLTNRNLNRHQIRGNK